MSLKVSQERSGNVLIVKLIGELDHHTAPLVKDVIEQQFLNGQLLHLVLNLKELEFMDSSGIGMILGRYKQIIARSGKMGICHMSPSISRLLEMSGLFKILVVGENEKHVISRLEVVSS